MVDNFVLSESGKTVLFICAIREPPNGEGPKLTIEGTPVIGVCLIQNLGLPEVQVVFVAHELAT